MTMLSTKGIHFSYRYKQLLNKEPISPAHTHTSTQKKNMHVKENPLIVYVSYGFLTMCTLTTKISHKDQE